MVCVSWYVLMFSSDPLLLSVSWTYSCMSNKYNMTERWVSLLKISFKKTTVPMRSALSWLTPSVLKQLPCKGALWEHPRSDQKPPLSLSGTWEVEPLPFVPETPAILVDIFDCNLKRDQKPKPSSKHAPGFCLTKRNVYCFQTLSLGLFT